MVTIVFHFLNKYLKLSHGRVGGFRSGMKFGGDVPSAVSCSCRILGILEPVKGFAENHFRDSVVQVRLS